MERARLSICLEVTVHESVLREDEVVTKCNIWELKLDKFSLEFRAYISIKKDSLLEQHSFSITGIFK